MTGMFAKVSLCFLTSALCCGGMGLYGQSALPVDEGTLLKQELELVKQHLIVGGRNGFRIAEELDGLLRHENLLAEQDRLLRQRRKRCGADAAGQPRQRVDRQVKQDDRLIIGHVTLIILHERALGAVILLQPCAFQLLMADSAVLLR